MEEGWGIGENNNVIPMKESASLAGPFRESPYTTHDFINLIITNMNVVPQSSTAFSLIGGKIDVLGRG